MKVLKSALICLAFTTLFASCSARPLKNNSRITRFLESEKWDYRIDNEGDFMIVSGQDSISREVWIRGHLNYSGEVAVREIFSASSFISESDLDSVSRVLLEDNMQTRIMGSWSIIRDEGQNRFVAVYIIKAGLNADKSYIKQGVMEASEAVDTLERVLLP
ncbi:MAG: hypothetical protein PQJ50_09995 [Spirochaetales bacterium]|nr:hypothetical protein [Spirochaetales bacterium]